MRRKRILARVLVSQLRLRFLIALTVLSIVCALLTTDFLWEWHKRGDVHAQAFGSLLTFFAAITTALVTLVYLHVSRRSLAAAEAAIQLQREQWETRMTVKPRFWLVDHSREAGSPNKQHTVAVTYRRDVADGYRKGSTAVHHYYETLNWPRFVVDVWNDGERSMRIGSYRLWVKDEEGLAIERKLVGFVIPPNELKSFTVTDEMVALAFRQRNFQERFERMPCEETVLVLRLYYSDWRDDDHASYDAQYLLRTPPFAREVVAEHMRSRPR